MTRIPQTAYKKNAIGDLPMAFLFRGCFNILRAYPPNPRYSRRSFYDVLKGGQRARGAFRH